MYHIFTDASCDMRKGFADTEDIRIIPMSYTLGGEERVCKCAESDDTMRRFYNGQRHGDLTQTTQISPQNYIEQFSPILEKGESILYLSLSSGLSSTFSSAVMAANELNDRYKDAKVYPVDSLSATAGMCCLLDVMVKNKKCGMSAEDNAKWVKDNALRVQHWFAVDDLNYLHRGGRVSAASAAVGTALNIKPILDIEADGTLAVKAKKRGSKLALKLLLEKFEETRSKDAGQRVYVINADNPEAVEVLSAGVKRISPSANVYPVMLSPIIGAHTGPGMCALAFLGSRESARR